MTNSEQFWNDKKPKADITYQGRVLPTSKTRLAIDVKLFVQPQDCEIKVWLKQKGLVFKSVPSDNEILKIYKEHQRNFFRYAHDNVTFGVTELWVFPHEMRALIRNGKGLDCDDYACSLASTLIAAGVPAWRVRCVAGTTRRGEGHLTTYILDQEGEIWKHLNSTTPASMIVSAFDKLPSSKTESDKMGIRDIWFSFNNFFAWHSFETGASEKSFKKARKYIRIRPHTP